MSDTDLQSPPRADERAAERVEAAVAFLRQAATEGRRFGILLGDPASTAAAVAAFVAAAAPGLRCVRVPAPTDSPHAFLEAILVELGFDPFESTADDLQRLLGVVFRQASGPGDRCVVILEQAHHFGPRVFETVRDIARTPPGEGASPLFVLTGSAALSRVLESRGMAAVADLTRHRVLVGPDLAAPAKGPAEPGDVCAGPHLVVLRGSEVAHPEVPVRGRVLIGRSPHNDLVLPSRYVSRHHAMITEGADGPLLMDLKSTNGTFVNSRAQRTHALQHGDWINIGNYRLRFEDPARAHTAGSGPRGEMPGLGETLVMRSLHPLRDPAPAEPDADSASSA
jgi:hypothetical protein